MFKNFQKRLRSGGIWSYCENDETFLVCGIADPNLTNAVFVERFGRSVCVGTYDEFDTRLIDPFHITRIEGGFKYHNRPAEVFGVENLDQISGVKDDIEEVIAICEKYLLHPQVDVLGWPMPLYQHPTWELGSVTATVRCATQISMARMDELVIKSREAAHRSFAARRKLSPEELCKLFFYPICINGRDPRSKVQDGCDRQPARWKRRVLRCF